MYFTPEDGIAAGLGLIYIFHHFGEDGYGSKLRITDRFSTKGNLQIKISDEFHHVIGKWDILLAAEAAQPYPTTYFYGAGNETVRRDDVTKKYYQYRRYGVSLYAGLQRVFWQKSSFGIGMNYELNNAILFSDNFIQKDQPVLGVEELDYFGPSANIDIDFRDNPSIPKKGVRFFYKPCLLTL